jgi:two-component system response regulator YesN
MNLEERFGGKHNMQFVLLNGFDELITIDGCVLLSFDERSSLIMFPFPKTISRNLYEDIQLLLEQIQIKMIQYLKTGISFYLGGTCKNLTELKTQAQRILDLGSFRFYAGENCLVKWQAIKTTKDDIFVHYANILQSIRNCIVGKDKQLAVTTVHHWIIHINHLKYPVEAVQGLVLKLVTEIELKYTMMQSFVTNFNVEQFHRIIYAIETLDHLERWLTHYLEQKITSLGAIKDVSLRKEVAEAKRYVIMNPGEKISMEEMAQRIHMNSSHFSRMFKFETGENFISFVTRVKMERAQELLDQSDLTVQEIAEQLGYEHTSYFIKLFRNYSGHSPSEQRRRL